MLQSLPYGMPERLQKKFRRYNTLQILSDIATFVFVLAFLCPFPLYHFYPAFILHIPLALIVVFILLTGLLIFVSMIISTRLEFKKLNCITF
jgi:hypothetical protein